VKGGKAAAKQTKGKENLDDILGEFVTEGGDQKLTKAQMKRLKRKKHQQRLLLQRLLLLLRRLQSNRNQRSRE